MVDNVTPFPSQPKSARRLSSDARAKLTPRPPAPRALAGLAELKGTGVAGLPAPLYYGLAAGYLVGVLGGRGHLTWKECAIGAALVAFGVF